MGTSPAVASNVQSIFSQIQARSRIQPVSNLFDEFERDAYKKTHKLHFNAEPLALVLAQIEMGKPLWEIGEWLKDKQTKEILALKTHVEQALEIKRYYRNKLIMRSLKHSEQNFTKFRQDLRNYVESEDPYTIFETDIPMILKLPEFYNEDKMMDEFVKEYRMNGRSYENATDSRFLHPLRKHHRKTRNSDQLHFWFRDANNLVYRISLDPKNPLLHLFEREFSKETVCLNGTFYATRVRGQDYVFYSLNNWNIV